MREIQFSSLRTIGGARRPTCHAGLMSSSRARRCTLPAHFAVTYVPAQSQAGMPERHYRRLCTKHAARFAARHGGGRIDLTDLLTFKEP